MNKVPPELKYIITHEWVRNEKEHIVTVGITYYAQELLGDIVFVELPEINTQVRSGDECGVVESVKAASDIFTPLTGEIIEINENLQETPGLINEDPYGDGWIFQLRLSNPKELDSLLSAEYYEKQTNDKIH